MTAKKNILAFFIIGILGTLGHFVYEWTGKIYTVGLFFPVNESTWEHLKLLLFPTLIYFTVEYFTLKERPCNYIASSVIGIFIGMLTIVVVFYTYKGVIGTNIDFINILIYFLGVITTLIARQIFLKNLKCNISIIYFLIPILIFTMLFTLFSYNAPKLGIFEAPNLNP